jgi:3-oxoadipate enol-lactonase
MDRELNGVSLSFDWFDEAGEAAPVIVFAHCLGGDRGIWRHQLAHFRTAYRLLAFDLRGQGRSALGAGPIDMGVYAADALALFDALAIDEAVFCGVSMGGMVALQTALAEPAKVRALVLADTAAGFDAAARDAWSERIATVEREGVAPLSGTMMARWFTDGFRRERPDLVAGIAATFARTPAEGYLAACRAIRGFDVRERLPGIRCPTLVVCGEDDPSTPLALSKEIAAAVPAARLAVIPATRHLPNFECPQRFNALVGEFLSAL